MNHLDGKFLILLLGLVHSALSFSKEVTLSIGISVLSTFTVCIVLSIIAWNCCLRSQGARKHQFDVEQEGNKGFVLANYDNTVNCNTPKIGPTLQCPKCGHLIERNSVPPDGSLEVQRLNSVKNKSNGCKGANVDVVVHNNSRSFVNSTTDTTFCSNQLKVSTNIEESSIAPANEERSTFVVKLKKTDSGSLGLSIVGGRCSRLGDIGVFIKSTIDNTPAASSGQLKPWDQILKVNNVDLDGKTLEEALMIIKEQSCDITLTILPSEQATAHLEASLSLKASQVDGNKLKTDWSSLREEEITTADCSSPSNPHTSQHSTETDCADRATRALGDLTGLTSSLDPVTSHSTAVRSSGDLSDSDCSLSAVQEVVLSPRDDDVFITPRSITSNLRGETISEDRESSHVSRSYEEDGCGYEETLETNTIRVDLDHDIQEITPDIIVK